MSPRIPLVCRLNALTPQDRARHAVLAAELRERALTVEGLAHGYALHFPDDLALSRRLLDWVALERRCCPFLEFEILLGEEGEPVTLRLTGPEGAREFLADELGLEPRVPPPAGRGPERTL